MIEPGGDIYFEMNRRTIPYAVNLELTASCNLDCVHCYHVRASGPEMNTREARELLDSLAGLGTMELTLTGGEPLTRHDFFPILHHAVEARGFSVKIFSNLTLLDREGADVLAALPLRGVETTILGPCADLHDRLARMPGAFEAAMRGIRLLTGRSVRVTVKTVLMRENFEALGEMERLAGDLGAAFRSDDGIYVESNGGRGPLAHRIPEREAMRRRKKDGGFGSFALRSPCNAGRSVMSIGPGGAVYPCGAFPAPAGSIREHPLGDIWRDSPLMRRMRSLSDEDYRGCGECRYTMRCGGCMAMGWGLSRGRMYPCGLRKRKLGGFV
jgi:AdoMet-dependent heme synthase